MEPIPGYDYCIHCGGPMPKRRSYFLACSWECLDAYAILSKRNFVGKCPGCGKLIAQGWGRTYCTLECRAANVQRRDTISEKLRQQVYAKTGGVCAYCGDRAEHVDHIIPFSKGGRTVLSNLAPACVACNLTAHDYLAENFEAKRQYILNKRGPLPLLRAQIEPEETFARPKWHAWVYGGVKRKHKA